MTHSHKKKPAFVKAHDADTASEPASSATTNPTQKTETTMNAQTNTSSTSSKSSSANSNTSSAQNAYSTAQNAYTNAFQQATSAFQNAFNGASNPFASLTTGSNPFSAMPGMPTAEEISNTVRANGEALVRSAQTFTQGVNQLTQAATTYMQNVLQMSVAATQAAVSARTLREITDLQNDYAKTSFDALVENSTRMSELSLKIANDAAQPLSQRLNETMQQFSQQQGSSSQSRAA